MSDPNHACHAQACGSAECLYHQDSNTLREQLTQINTKLAVIESNFIKLADFLRQEEAVRTMRREINVLWKIVWSVVAFVFLAFGAALKGHILGL